MVPLRLVVPLLLVACSGDGSADPDTTEVSDISYHRNVRPLVDRHCAGCHSEGNIGPFRLDTPEEALTAAEAMVVSVEARTMPPWGMDPDCRPSVGDLRLSDAVVDVFTAWRDAGFPEGDPADYGAPDFPEPLTLGTPDLLLTPSESYTPKAGKLDDYRCMVIQEPLGSDLFVTGLDIQPDNVNIVHHVLLYAIPPAGHAELDAKIAEDPEPGYECFGTSGLDNAQTVGGWVPGNLPTSYGEGVAQRIPGGSRLVLQMHYNTAGGSGSDQTSVGLWTLPEGDVPDTLMTVFPVPKLDLDIQPGDANSVQTERQRLPIPEGSMVMATSPHMHLLGTSLSTKIIRADGSEQCLSQVDRWDFDWQRSYGIPEVDRFSFTVHDEVEITCTYDNSAANQPVVDGTAREPEQVGWGDGSYDEMCLDYLALVRPYEGDGTGDTCAEFDVCAEGCPPGDGICTISCLTASGESCLYCGLDGLFGTCVGAQCIGPGLALQVCMDECAGDRYTAQFECLYTGCRSELEAYMECAKPVLEGGSCVDAFPGCESVGSAP